jgi:hypothetical protein
MHEPTTGDLASLKSVLNIPGRDTDDPSLTCPRLLEEIRELGAVKDPD